jgi:hypothetical protein
MARCHLGNATYEIGKENTGTMFNTQTKRLADETQGTFIRSRASGTSAKQREVFNFLLLLGGKREIEYLM